ncbi:MAG: hypothetical protein ACKVU0_08765 [Saprospiraceae bacterium]
MKFIPKLLTLWALLVVFSHSIALAQTDAALLRDLAEENKKSVEALVLYPSDTRLAILEATKHPEVLIKMQSMREKTSAAFRTLIEDFPRSTQEVFYDLSRYPGMTASLVQQKNNPAALRTALEALPVNKREDAFGVVTRQMPTFVQINDLNQTTRRAFERLIAGYSAPAQKAFEHLLGLPEVIDLLNEDLRFTILVGETYRDNPAWVIQKMDSLNLAVARSHAEELENWKTTLENDPAAKSELQAAAKEYANENGYNSDDYSGDDLYYEGDYYARDNDIQVWHYYSPYPYWYGYPYWEPYPRWRPYPWWWDWGGYYYPHGFVIVYLPSYHFMNWYFYHPHHHHHYNHLSTHFVNHYYGHRHSGTTITMGVRDWHERNRSVISDDVLADKKRLPDRLKEYGQFETGRQEYNAKNPKKQLTQEEYLDKNLRKYPDLQRSRETAKTEMKRENEVKREKRSDWAPPKAPAKPEPAHAPKTQRPPRIETPPTQKPPRTEKPVTRDPSRQPRTQPDEAKDYHRQKWEESKPAQRQAPATRRSNPAPAPKSAPGKGNTTPKKRGN